MTEQSEGVTLSDVLSVLDEWERKRPTVVTSDRSFGAQCRQLGLKVNVTSLVPDGKAYIVKPDQLEMPVFSYAVTTRESALERLRIHLASLPLQRGRTYRRRFVPLDIAAERARLDDLGRRIAATRASIARPEETR